MRHPRQLHDPVRILWKRLGLLGLCLVLIILLGAVWGVYGKLNESAMMRHEAEVRLSDLQRRYDALSASVESLDSQEGKEAMLRDTHDVGRPGEGLIVIVDQKAPLATSTGPQAPVPWWQFW